jgi:hypothetical protein
MSPIDSGPNQMCAHASWGLGAGGWSNDIRNWSELGPLRHEELAPLLS